MFLTIFICLLHIILSYHGATVLFFMTDYTFVSVNSYDCGCTSFIFHDT